MKNTLTTGGTTTTDVDAARLDELAKGTTFFWLDLEVATDGSDNQDLSSLLLDRFGFHTIPVQGAMRFGQRPKLDDYDTFTYVVALGCDADGAVNQEVHLFVSPHSVVTVHQGPCPCFAEVAERIGRHQASEFPNPQVVLTYLVMDALTDSFFPALTSFDERIDTLEEAILQNPTEEQLGDLFDMKRRLVVMRRVITPQRDMFAGVSSGLVALPGATDESTRYFRDLYDHTIRISDLVDSYRDLVTGATDSHISMVSNRLNVVMKQLAIIATIFLPLSFLTGFFGQNFGILTNHLLPEAWTFWVFGIGIEVLAVVVMFWFFRRKGWLGGPTA